MSYYPRKIFIFGCARSGTTLLQNLFRCFRKTKVVDREHRIEDFERFYDGENHIVLKRTPQCANSLIENIKKLNDIWIVDIYRDPRDVVTSRYPGILGYYTDFARWERDIKVVETLQEFYKMVIRIRYETLIDEAGRIQKCVASTIGLEEIGDFKNFNNFVSENDISQRSVEALGGIRPLDQHNIQRWRKKYEDKIRVKEQVKCYPQMVQYLIDYSYEKSSDWLHLL